MVMKIMALFIDYFLTKHESLFSIFYYEYFKHAEKLKVFC